jgi:dipeptidyl aminopeptidase/acylaminoacyl peptidase
MNDTLTITHRFIVNPLARRYNGVDQVTRTTEQRVADRTEFLKQLPLFVNLPEAELAGLAQDFTARRFQQGETIFFQGDPGQVLYLIETGRVRIYVQDDSGQESSVIYYSAGDIFGEVAVLRGHEYPVTSAQFSPDGEYIVTGSEDTTARVWEALTGNEVAILCGHEGEITNAQFSPDGKYIVTASDDGMARVYLAHSEDLIALAKTRVTRDLTYEERVQYLHEDRVRATPTPMAVKTP